MLQTKLKPRLATLHKILSFPFNLSKQPLQEKASIVSIVMNPTKEDDFVALGDDAYYCLLGDALDSGDTRTVSEVLEDETDEDENMRSEDDVLLVTTRSGRRSAQKRNGSGYVFY